MGVRKNSTTPLEIPSMISPLVGASCARNTMFHFLSLWERAVLRW